VVPFRSLPLIKDALLSGEIDSGLVYRSYADRHPEALRVDEVVGSPDDVWDSLRPAARFSGQADRSWRSHIAG
jgi:hypothetical protein